MGSAICGGVISLSQLKRGMKTDIYYGMMSYVMPDKQYREYIDLGKQGKYIQARKLFEKYARSQI